MKYGYRASFDLILVTDADKFYCWDQTVPLCKTLSFRVHTLRTTHLGSGSIVPIEQYPLPLQDLGSCYSNPNSDSCPDWQGRSKILSMLSRYPNDIGVHGNSYILASRGYKAVHYDHHKEHTKEWPGVAKAPQGQSTSPLNLVGKSTIVHCEPQTFVESKDVFLGVHWQAEAFPILPNGTLVVIYDDELSPWLQSVASILQHTTSRITV